MITATRYHDFSAGHRVVGHESKCALIHGHNYRVHFTVAPWSPPKAGRRNEALDALGRVLDFSVINTKLCQWLEVNWDHKLLLYVDDPLRGILVKYPSSGVVVLPFNPTAENMAIHLVDVVGPQELAGTRCELISVTVEETRKCSATYTRGDDHALRHVIE